MTIDKTKTSIDRHRNINKFKTSKSLFDRFLFWVVIFNFDVNNYEPDEELCILDIHSKIFKM